MGDYTSSSPDAPCDTASSSGNGAVMKKRELRRSKRDQKSWENMYKTISHLPNDEKLSIIEAKYKELFNEYRIASSTLKDYEKRYSVLQKEKQHVSNELTKTIMSRSKIECLARELQKQNREIKEENYNRLKEEEDKRKLVAASFTEKLNTLTTLMDESTDKSLHLREENLNMTSKLTELYTQFQEREAHLTNMNNQMELQRKLSEAQLKKQEFSFEAERHLWQNEKLVLLDQLQKSEETNKVLQENVKTLQEHLNTYQKQYNDFETTMKRSSEVFDTFKEEIAKMHKSNAALEKDRNEWHNRWHSATQTIIHLTELHQQAVSDQKAFERKVKMLEKLCRKLNLERSSYIVQLKENNIEPVTPNEDDEELTAKEKQIVILKDELKAIEEQLNLNAPTKTAADVDEEEKMSYKITSASSSLTDVLRRCHSESKFEKVSATSFESNDDHVDDYDDGSTETIPVHAAEANTILGGSTETIPLHATEADTDLEELAKKCDLNRCPSRTNLYDPIVDFDVKPSTSKDDKRKKKRGGVN